MHESLFLSYPDNLTISSLDDGQVILQTPRHRLNLGRSQAVTRPIMNCLFSPGVPFNQLVAAAKCTHEYYALSHLFRYLQKLSQNGMLHFVLHSGEARLATLVSTKPILSSLPNALDEDRAFLLSRFTVLRMFERQVIVESPLTPAHLVLHEPKLAGLILSLTRAQTCEELVANQVEFSRESIQQLLQLLCAGQFVVPANADGSSSEDSNRDLQGWEFHDVLFHTRSRRGKHDYPLGSTYPLASQEPPPACKRSQSGEPVSLDRPDLARVAEKDLSLTDALEQRRSLRLYGKHPITSAQLGEFLYRVARAKSRSEVQVLTPDGPKQVEMTSRPYPSGGGLYPLEFYICISNCRGLEPGLYHYAALEHQLNPISAITEDVRKLLTDASNAMGTASQDMQILLVTTARFRRVNWKYSSLAYALILKEVGIVMQNMYLVATAMGLAPCALGTGDSDLFARVIGSDYFAETSVGEFVLGSAPDPLETLG